MTTINNYESLIEKVGGIEKAKVIVGGAPKFIRESISQDETMYNPRTKKYIERGPYSVLIQLDGEDDYYHSTMPYHSSFYAECIFLSDLCTAISQHNQLSGISREFKVGDLVVLKQSHSQDKVLKIQMFHDDFIRAFADSKNYSFGHKVNFRHATPEEIKAGHRLDHADNPSHLTEDAVDMVTDIRNHISPNTKVVEL